MTKRIFISILTVAVSVFLAAFVLIMGMLYDYFSDMQLTQLKTQTTLASQGVAHDGAEYFENLETDNYRITWIASDGTVLYDSEADAKDMENHLDREEVKEALESGYGESTRYSDTRTQVLIYCAERLPDGSVLRLSGSHYTIFTLAFGALRPIIVVAFIAIILSFVIAFYVAKSIVKPLNELDLDNPLENKYYEELTPLIKRIDSQQKQLKRQSTQLRRHQDEFNAATHNMTEGLVLLNESGIILSINRAASRLLSVDKNCIGKDITELDSPQALLELLDIAKSGKRTQTVLNLSGADYQFNASPVVSDDAVVGIALLMFDITEIGKSEEMRREFTANVSHELKTPLHSISGYAELLKSGMVKEQDIQMFSGRIYSEARRMIYLIDDIIKLSHLDEGAGDMSYEQVDLYLLAEGTLKILDAAADERGITLELTGTHATLNGVPQLLGGIIYNLCDNAIKYNRENGKVTVDVSATKDSVLLTVSDTGIGIPKEHTERIFERFYRVDKSHSKELGGTGLGLSIVKHTAKLHNAEIEVNSTVNEGTVITVNFPN